MHKGRAMPIDDASYGEEQKSGKDFEIWASTRPPCLPTSRLAVTVPKSAHSSIKAVGFVKNFLAVFQTTSAIT